LCDLTSAREGQDIRERDMKKRSLAALLAAVAASLAVAGGQASADPDSNNSTSGLTDPALLALITDDDLFSTADLAVILNPAGTNGTKHYGPFPSTSPDSGTCGNDWATDTFDRHFTVRPDGDVVQQFKQGSFVANEGPSPGSCETTDGSPPGTVSSGVTGSMHGYFIISTGPFAQSSTDPSCVAGAPSTPCTTAGFINSHFAGCAYPAAPCMVTTFFFHFAAGDQGLVEHEWKNASVDRGGNHGDIRSTNVP
jgi:hypothetical protein